MKCTYCGKEIHRGWVTEERYGVLHFCSGDCVEAWYGIYLRDAHPEWQEEFPEEIDSLEREVRRLGI